MPKTALARFKRALARILIRTGFMLRGIRPIAGGEQTAEEKAAAEKAATDKAAADTAAAEAAAKAKTEEEALGDAGKAAIRREREARATAERELRAANEKAKKWDAHEASQLSEEEKVKRERDAERAKSGQATTKLRKAHVISELAKSEHGIADATAAAALIKGVEFDDQDQPTNLKDRVEALLTDHPVLKGTATVPPPPSTNGSQGSGGNTPVKLSAEQAAAAQMFGIPAEEYALYTDLHPKIPAAKKE